MSLVSAVFTLKAFNYTFQLFFVGDLNLWRLAVDRELGAATSTSGSAPYFVKFILCAVVCGLLVALFYHSIISAMQAGACVERAQRPSTPIIDVTVDRATKRKRHLFALFECACGLILVALAMFNLVARDNNEWNANYDRHGISTMWLGVLLLGAGVCSAGQLRTLTTGVYVLAACITVSCVDSGMTIGSSLVQTIAQNDTTPPLRSLDGRTGRIVLQSIQTGAILVALITSVVSLIRINGDIRRLAPQLPLHRDTPLMLLGVLHLIYLVASTGAESAFEYAKREANLLPESVRQFEVNMDGRLCVTTMIAQLVAGRRVG